MEEGGHTTAGLVCSVHGSNLGPACERPSELAAMSPHQTDVGPPAPVCVCRPGPRGPCNCKLGEELALAHKVDRQYSRREEGLDIDSSHGLITDTHFRDVNTVTPNRPNHCLI
ncbi:hypothetical protein J6590_008082 [Homalodisca vitripennis]|nr:hypothetical protein J6590_008082 [Homalodisca vitripennis]